MLVLILSLECLYLKAGHLLYIYIYDFHELLYGHNQHLIYYTCRCVRQNLRINVH